MANAQPPVIIPGQALPYTKRPFLGKWVNHIIGLYNGIVRLRVNVISQSSSSVTTAAVPSFVITAQGAILTIPIPPPATTQTGWFWNSGSRNYDETQTFQEQQVVYVAPTSTAATTGLLDAGSLATVKSAPGIYVCLKANAPEVISGTTYYRVPQLPLPVPGDMDNAGNYWVLISQEPQCI